jgi:hypothetical protein
MGYTPFRSLPLPFLLAQHVAILTTDPISLWWFAHRGNETWFAGHLWSIFPAIHRHWVNGDFPLPRLIPVRYLPWNTIRTRTYHSILRKALVWHPQHGHLKTERDDQPKDLGVPIFESKITLSSRPAIVNPRLAQLRFKDLTRRQVFENGVLMFLAHLWSYIILMFNGLPMGYSTFTYLLITSPLYPICSRAKLFMGSTHLSPVQVDSDWGLHRWQALESPCPMSGLVSIAIEEARVVENYQTPQV